MAFYPTNLVSSGGTSETVLWTNPSPTSSFAGQAITLSSISGYNFVKIYYRLSTTNSAENAVIYAIDDARRAQAKSLYYSDNLQSYMVLAANFGTGVSSVQAHIRRIEYESDTEFSVIDCFQQSTTTKNNNNIIPTKICGLK